MLSIIDGAHAPGQIPVDLRAIDADIYTGACHKWMLAPKGASFLYANPRIQERLAPLVVSWGYDPDPGFGSGNPFIDYHEWQGTRDLSAYLAVPAAINYMADHHWDQVRKDCHQLALKTRQQINALTGYPPVCPPEGGWLGQMFTAYLPDLDTQGLKNNLLDPYKIEVPVTRWNDQNFIRISVQGYNTEKEMDALVAALSTLLKA
jgi:isopenicillin-N epimerase